MKKTLLSLCIMAGLFAVTGCSSNQESASSTNTTTDKKEDTTSSVSSESSSGPESTNDGSNALVIYFSATNHTESVANTIATHIDAPIYELEPVNPYTSADLNYSNQDSRVVEEHEMTQSGNRVNVELVNTHFDEFDDADYIFLGAPVWWQQLSWVIENFVAENDFSNKTIIPFGTSASSGFNLNNITPLTEDDSNVTWLSPQRFSSSVSSNTVINWVDSLGFDF